MTAFKATTVLAAIGIFTAAAAMAGGALAGATAPSNTSAPSIVGYTQQGVPLSASPGSWAASPSPTFAYQWMRCTAVGASCKVIPGAIAASYTPVAADVGQTLQIAVTATDSSGSASVNSAPSSAVRPPVGTIVEYKLPGTVSAPSGIAKGPDGNVWFTIEHGGMVGKITPTGAIGLYPVAPATSSLGGIATGPDGNIWLTDFSNARIVRITPAGANLTLFPVAGTPGLSAITGGADGNVWFAETQSSALARISTTGSGYTKFPTLTAGAWPHGLNPGPDGNLWFAEIKTSKVGRITPSGSVSEWAIPTANSNPRVIVTGADGNVWFTEFTGNRIGRITSSGVTTEFLVPTASSAPVGIAQGQDGYVWFTEQSGNKIGRLAMTGAVTEFLVPTAVAQPDKIVLGADGNLWFTERSVNKIGMIVSGPPVSIAPVNTIAPVISGPPTEGQTLRATQGSWSGLPVPGYSYQWSRCDQAATNCVSIPGATGSAYSLSGMDTGMRMQVQVTATSGSTVVSAYSAATATVSGPPAPIAPTVSGVPVVSQTLSVVAGGWGGYPAPVLSYQWSRCDLLGGGCSPVVGETGSSFVLTAADVGWALEVSVTGTNASGTVTVSSPQTASVSRLAEPPVSVVPVVSGSAVEGQTLSVSPGVWGGYPAPVLSYQWSRCDQSGGGCSPIAEAAGGTYVLGAGDVGGVLEVGVTGENASGTVTVPSAQTAVIAGLGEPPVPVVPVVSGLAVEGEALSVVPGVWGGNPAPVLSYRWWRCDVLGVGCSAIPGATESSYVLVAADVGGTVEVSVTGSNGSGAVVVGSGVGPVVVGPPVSVVPIVSGVAVEGQTLSVSPGVWGGYPAPVLSYQWSRCDEFGGGCSPIAEAAGGTYVLGAGDVGGILEVRVTGTNASGTVTVSSAQTAVIAGLGEPPVPVVPVVSGVTVGGQTLTVVPDAWGGYPAPALSYQWSRCDVLGVGCSAIPGATESSYVLAAADVGGTVEVSVTGTNASGTVTVSSAQTAVILGLGEPPVSVVPVVSGSAVVGQTLSVSPGVWGGYPAPVLSYQWLRCDQSGGSCSPIAEATGSTYVLAAGDVGGTVEVSVTGSNGSGAVVVGSGVGPVVVGPPVSVVPIVSGVAVEGQTLSVSPGVWDGYPAPVLTYQWSRCDQFGGNCGPITGATASAYALGAGDVGGMVEVSVTGANATGTASVASHTSAVIVSAPGPLTPVLDNFNRVNNVGPPSANWTHAGILNNTPKNNLYVVGSQAAGTAGTDTDFWNASSFGADSEVFVTVASLPSVNGDLVALGLRMQSPAASTTSGYQGFYVRGITTPDEYKIVLRTKGTSDTALVSTTAGPKLAPGDKLLFRAIASMLELWVYDSGTWSKVLNAKSSAIASGGYAMLTARNSVVRLDDFGGGTLP